MKKYQIIILLVLGIYSCKDQADINQEVVPINACGVESFDRLTWAQILISGKGTCENIYKDAQLIMYNYKGEKVFHFINGASSLASCTQAVYDCEGLVLIPFSAEKEDWEDFESNRSNKKILWKKL